MSTQVEHAVSALRNNAVVTVVESKSASLGLKSVAKTSYPPELILALRGMFSAQRNYDFQLHQVLDVVSSTGGSTLGFVAISPSVASYGEWSALAALFDEVKALSTSIAWHSTTVVTALGGDPAIALALDQQDLSTDPSSALAVYRLAGSKTFTAALATGGSGKFAMAARFGSRGFCTTAVPYSTSPMGGMIGCWVYGNDGLYPVSTTVAHVFSKTIARFRSRA